MANLAQRAAAEPDPHLHPGLRGAGVQRGAHREADRRRHRHPAPRGGADGGALRREPGGGAGQPGPADLRRAERLLHVARHPRRRVHRGAVGHGRRRALRRLHLLPRPAGAAALVPARRLGAARPAGGRGRRWRPGRCAAPAGRCHRRPAGPSSPRWSATATICWRSTSWPTRSSSPDSSVSSWRRASPRRWPTACPLAMRAAAHRRDAGPHAALGHQRHGAAALPGRAAAARQRRGQHGLLAGAAGAAGGPGPLRERGPPAGSGALPAAGPEGHAAAHRPARARPGAVRAAQERLRAAVRSLDPARPERLDGPDPAGPAGDRAAGLDPAAVERLWRAFREGAPGMYWSRVWSVYVLIRWCHRHGVRR